MTSRCKILGHKFSLKFDDLEVFGENCLNCGKIACWKKNKEDKIKMTNLREEIAEQFNESMGHWEGIDVPDHEQGYRAIDYADKILKLFEQRVESIKNENTPKILEYTLMDSNEKALFTGYHKALEEVKEILKEK